MCASFTYMYHSTLVLSTVFSSDYMSYLRRWRHTYQSCCASSWSLMSIQPHRIRLFQDMVVKCKQAFCLEDVYSFLFSRCTSLAITKLFSNKNDSSVCRFIENILDLLKVCKFIENVCTLICFICTDISASQHRFSTVCSTTVEGTSVFKVTCLCVCVFAACAGCRQHWECPSCLYATTCESSLVFLLLGGGDGGGCGGFVAE